MYGARLFKIWGKLEMIASLEIKPISSFVPDVNGVRKV